jgi:hypothetical protein
LREATRDPDYVILAARATPDAAVPGALRTFIRWQQGLDVLLALSAARF